MHLLWHSPEKKNYMCLKTIGNLKGQGKQGTNHSFRHLSREKIMSVNIGQVDVSLSTKRGLLSISSFQLQL
jgi:hypothetical protein